VEHVSARSLGRHRRDGLLHRRSCHLGRLRSLPLERNAGSAQYGASVWHVSYRWVSASYMLQADCDEAIKQAQSAPIPN
jgi:hypothetical protein